MFTGLVKAVGNVKSLSREADSYKLAIESREISQAADTGDSVAVNGVCLTITGKKGSLLYFDAVAETVRRTSLSRLKAGSPVNLEGSLRAGDPLGGHFVLGHVDCTGIVKSVVKTGKSVAIEVSFPEDYAGLVVEKGSVALDGVSLTVGEISRASFKVYIIPHTTFSTTLKDKKRGDEVNIEFDILGKYILRQKELGKVQGITEDFLKEKGFI